MVGAKSATIGFFLAAYAGAQTFFWNPSPAGGGEVQRSANWTAQADGGGLRPLSVRDDDFADTDPGPWSTIDSVPVTASTISYSSNPGKLTITARGGDVWFDFNQFAAVYRTDIAGAFDVTVKVESQDSAHEWSKCGLMVWNDFRNTRARGGVIVAATPGQGIQMQHDSSEAAGPSNGPGRIDATTWGSGPVRAVHPRWLRLVKRKSASGQWIFAGYHRAALTAPWTLIRDNVTPLGIDSISQVGLFVTSHNPNQASTVVFDDFHGGGDIAGNNLDLSFGGTGSSADNNAVLGANLAAGSVDFTGYTGTFSFGGWALSLSGNATFSPTMGINPNTGGLILNGASGVQTFIPKANDTLPVVRKTGGSEVVVGGSIPLLADSLHIAAGIFDLGSRKAHLLQLTTAGGTLEGLTAATDTLFIHGRADFSGLATLTPGLGTIAIKATGNGAVAAFDPGGKTFGNLLLWTVPQGTSGAAINIGPGDLTVSGNLVFRHQRAPTRQNGYVDFQVHNPDVTVGGSISQIIEGTGDNWHPIRMGAGTWNVAGNVAFSLNGGSSGTSVLNLTGSAGIQTLAVTDGALATVGHAAAGTVQQANALSAGSLSLTGGTWNMNGQDLTLSGNLAVEGAAGTLSGLGGSDIVVLGNASFTGTAASRLNLAPATAWTVDVTGTFTADHVNVGNSKALRATGMAGANSADQGGNINWSFNASPPTAVPVIGTEPRDTTVMEGTAAAFSVAATGHSLAYEWRRAGDTAVIGRAADLPLSSVTLSQNGFQYQCIVSNSSGKDTSRLATLTVTRRPVPASVSQEPVDALVQVGQGATFTVAASGDAPIAYAWRKRGDTAVLAATATLTLSNLALAQDDSYYQCIVSNPHGADTTREARLDVVPVPVPARITREPRDSTVFVTQGVSFSVAAEGSQPLAFAWRKVGDTAVLSTDPVLAFAAATQAQDSSVYRCVVSNAHGADTSAPARLTVLPPPVGPRIVREPADTLVKVGARVRFSAGVLGTGPLRYEWRRRGDTAVLSSDSLFVIDSARESMSGNSYYVIVSNSPITGEKDTSAEARLTVRVCDSLTIQIARDTAVEEGRQATVWGRALCADRSEWSVISGPAPRLLDPEADTLAVRAPRVKGDTAILYRFTAYIGDSSRSKDVRVGIREAVPDPSMALPADLPWTGERPLVLKPTVFNNAQLNLFTGYPLRYAWSLEPLGADTLRAGDSLTLRNPVSDGVLSVVLCMDNGGAAACDTVRVTVGPGPTALAPGLALPGGLRLQGSRLAWTSPGTVRLWDWRGRLLYEARGEPGTVREVPPAALRAYLGRRARLIFRP